MFRKQFLDIFHTLIGVHLSLTLTAPGTRTSTGPIRRKPVRMRNTIYVLFGLFKIFDEKEDFCSC
jgi:hypothetical protein